MVNFQIISCGWKCEDTIKRCIESVEAQTYKEWDHDYVVDEDDKGRFGKMKNFYYLAHSAKPDNIICDLDLDDTIPPDALETVARVYEEHPETLLTHGSYRMESGKPARFNGPYQDEKFRAAPWRGTHFKTFKASLFHRIKINDFKGPPDGNWLMSGADMAFMLPMLEMAGLDRIKYISKEIYVYNDLSPLNDHKTAPALQKRVEKYLRNKKPYRRI